MKHCVVRENAYRTCKLTTCLKNREMLETLVKIREMSGKNLVREIAPKLI